MLPRVFANTVLASWCTSSRRCIASLTSLLANPVGPQPTTPFVPSRPYLPAPSSVFSYTQNAKNGSSIQISVYPHKLTKRKKKSKNPRALHARAINYIHPPYTHTHTPSALLCKPPTQKPENRFQRTASRILPGRGMNEDKMRRDNA